MSTDQKQPSLREISVRLRTGKLTARSIADTCSKAWADSEPKLKAYKTWAGNRLTVDADIADKLFSQGRDLGPLHGIPVSVKDLFGVPGFPTFAGSPRALPADWEKPGPIIQKLINQMALFTGKTQTVEFAYGGLGTNPHWEIPRNPWDLDNVRVPGGSSSGAGVSVIQGSALVALGTDTAGSVRVPASMTGTVGLKTTKGLWSTEGITPLSTSFDTPGLFTRTAADAAYVYEAIQGERVPELSTMEGVRLGVPDHFFWDDCEAGISEAVRNGLKKLEKAGATLVPLELKEAEETFEYFKKGGLTPPELYAFLLRDLPEWFETLDPNVKARVEAGKEIPVWEYIQRADRLRELGARATKTLSTVDALVSPSVAITPPTISALQPEGEYPRLNIKALRNTCIGNLLGLCGITIPVGFDAQNMPVGLLFTAKPFNENRILAVAAAAEKVL